MKKRIHKILRQWAVTFIPEIQATFARDISFARSVKSLSTTADYIDEHMWDVPSVDHHLLVHDTAISHIQIANGLILEFGVFSGSTINHIATHLPDTSIFGFDSFEGLPEFWRDGFSKGHFALNQLPTVAPNVTLVKGWFDQTLPDFKAKYDQPVAYLHIDCDLYSSTKTIFDLLKDNIVEGTVIVFDEYFNYPGWMQGEFRAFREFLEETKKSYKYLVYNRMHEQVAVIIT
ncbi:class I SAM-dependent methyltransferase [Chitinophaga agri]|uniref:Class I SAM-dependent methyltransferase n=1 Tax=Chitinophaga agri TaxID=2703787 RepID=A0A6B9ZBD5_9BACT|nr:class I SAM-dependent methyltransferase [Chitinophaga agri]QHS59712.1 class I SAM-dependent methyltransferase [Chitinophaga agri]